MCTPTEILEEDEYENELDIDMKEFLSW